MSEHLGSDTSHGVAEGKVGVRTGSVQVGPLAQAYKRSGRTATEVAREMGWTRTQTDNRYGRSVRRRRPDVSKVHRTLGIKPYSPGHGYPQRVREFTALSTALKLAEVLGADPVEVGL